MWNKETGVKELTSKIYLPAKESFDVIEAANVAVGHGDRARLESETFWKYPNITMENIKIFSYTHFHMWDKSTEKCNKIKAVVSKTIIHPEMNGQCQVYLIDMQVQAKRRFKFIMVYQDHLTKFVMLRVL